MKRNERMKRGISELEIEGKKERKKGRKEGKEGRKEEKGKRGPTLWLSTILKTRKKRNRMRFAEHPHRKTIGLPTHERELSVPRNRERERQTY
jgi:hypothetical protein